MWHAVRSNLAWRAVLIAGVAAGTVFLLVNVIFTPLLLGVDATIVLRYMASLVLGSGVLTGDNAATLLVGLVVSYVLAFVYTLIIAIVVHRWGLIVGLVGGAILGLAFYGINLYLLTLLFEWFYAINNNVLLFSHVLFGITAGGVYEVFDHYDTPFELEVSHDAA
jgi:hypothetical protein